MFPTNLHGRILTSHVVLYHGLKLPLLRAGPALTDAGPNARPWCGCPLSSNIIMTSCSVNRDTIVAERRYTVQH